MPLGVELLLRGGSSRVPMRARNSLYGGKAIIDGRKYSREYEKPSRRIWKPNVVKVPLWSEALGQMVKLRVTTAVLKSIDHAGGLDAYLLKTPDRWLFSDVGSDLKYRIGLIYKQRWYDAAQARRLEQQQQQRQRQQQGTVAAEAPASTSSSPPAARPAAVTGPRGFSSGAGGAGSRGGAAELDALRRQEADKMLGWAGPRSSSSMGPGPPQQPSCQQHPGGG